MDFTKAMTELQALFSELCTLVASGEWYWYNLASDYQSKYASASDYDKSFKQTYNEKGSACRRIARELETIALPSGPEEMAAFMVSLNEHLQHFPRAVKLEQQIEVILEKMERIVRQ